MHTIQLGNYFYYFSHHECIHVFVECDDKTYGIGCKPCSQNCKNSMCRKLLDTMNCLDGCIPGKSGTDCSEGEEYRQFLHNALNNILGVSVRESMLIQIKNISLKVSTSVFSYRSISCSQYKNKIVCLKGDIKPIYLDKIKVLWSNDIALIILSDTFYNFRMSR